MAEAETPEEQGNLAPYVRQAHATFRNGFEDDDLKRIFLRNTFEEISGGAVRFCLSKSLSFCLEEMIKELDFESVTKFLDSISESYEEIAYNASGSHILQTIFAKIVTDLQDPHQLLLADLEKQILKLVQTLSSNVDDLEKLMRDALASHTFRSLFQILGGVLLADTGSSQRSGAQFEIVLDKSKIPKSFSKTLKTISLTIQEMPHQSFAQLLSDVHGSPSIAVILEVLNKRRLMKTLGMFCEKLFTRMSEESVIMMMKDRNASHVFEKIVQFGTKKVKKMLRKTLLEDEKRFFELGGHPIANFVIQRFISSAEDSETFKEIFDYVSGGFEDVLASQNYGVMQKICEQCLKFPDFQRPFYDKLLEAFHCTDIAKRATFVSLIATLRTHDSFFEDNGNGRVQKVEYHGSVLLQTLLKFKTIGIVIKSMNSIPVTNVVTMSCDSSGSHFIDSFLTSEKVRFKIKKELIEKVGDEWCKISCDKYGSRVFDKLWDASDIVVKRLLMDFLVKKADDLSKDVYGKYVCKKVQMKRYQTRLEEWEMIQKQICKKRKLFADIIPGNESAKKVKR